MLVLFFLYLGYIALAGAERERGGEGGSPRIFGLVGAINLPIIHYSVLWWRTLHQGAEHQALTELEHRRFDPLAASARHAGLHLLFGAIVLMRMRAELARAKVEARMRRLARMSHWPFVIAAYAVTLIGDRSGCWPGLSFADAPGRSARPPKP